MRKSGTPPEEDEPLEGEGEPPDWEEEEPLPPRPGRPPKGLEEEEEESPPPKLGMLPKGLEEDPEEPEEESPPPKPDRPPKGLEDEPESPPPPRDGPPEPPPKDGPPEDPPPGAPPPPNWRFSNGSPVGRVMPRPDRSGSPDGRS